MKDRLNQLAGELRTRLPEHTYKAVIRRVKREGHSDPDRLALLTAAIERWDNERVMEGAKGLVEVIE